MKRTLLLAAALLGAVVGCGGNDASGEATYVYASAEPIAVAAQTCVQVWEPVTVGNGSMHYAIDDLGGTDAIDAVIISDSFFSTEECGFTTDQTVVDVSVSGSSSGDPRVVADKYDFVVTCGNADVPCAFNLTWSATY